MGFTVTTQGIDQQALLLTTLVSSALSALLEEALRDGGSQEPLSAADSQPAGQDVYAFGFLASREEEPDAPDVEKSQMTLGVPPGHGNGVAPAATGQGRVHQAFGAPDVWAMGVPVSSVDGGPPGGTPPGSENNTEGELLPDELITNEGNHSLNGSREEGTGGSLDGPASVLNEEGLTAVPPPVTSGDRTSTELPEHSGSGSISDSAVSQEIYGAPATVPSVSRASTSASEDSVTTHSQPAPPALDTATGRPKCRQRLGVLNCSRLRLETFNASPKLTYIEELVLSFNRIKNLTRETFTGLKSLQKLFADHNRITFVSEDAFADLPDLKVLDLSYNQVQQLAPVAFSWNPQLFILNLSGNPLEVAGLGSWLRSDSLGVLFLNSCNATSLPADAFAGVTELLYLHLCGNGLRQLPPQLFRELTDLRHLYLDHNLLSSLPADVFAENLQLEWLFVRHNRVALSADEPFLNASSLLMLDLEDNRVSAVGERTFAGLQGLHNLTLRKNAIRRWAGPPPAQALPRLRYLDLSWNRLRLADLLPFPPYPALACANLGGNPAACDPAVRPTAFCVSGCRVSTPPRTAAAAALAGNCTRRSLRSRLERLEAMSRAADSLEALNKASGGVGGGGAGAAPGAEVPLRTATVGRTATLTRAAAAASLVAAETPLLGAPNGDAASDHYGGVDITCWLPERRRPPTTAGRKLF
ncbi:leucine-rich repeat protein SHOC-2-like [Schistocerca americana]|uniref:leucine-rich repeat protein SHOC-2-like n=1 Tax=Schistocerca americana TaxID=7009 RepID=UPI001F4FE68C|nr:leucine-rich repeat protein SHOC-2-like [Schistocerca americana]